MKFYHLSHTDLDGYGAQFISSFYLKNVTCFNSNYGKEIDEKFNHILSLIDDEKSIILITDLNLTLSQCRHYEELIKNKNIKLILLDHHQSGIECVKKFDWYFLDSSRSATKITYDFFSKIFDSNKELSNLVDVINSVDIWLSDKDEFELGKVMLSMVANAKEINRVMFEEESFKYMQFLIEKSKKFLCKSDANILLDDNLHSIKKEFFKKDKNNTLLNLVSDYIVMLLSKKKDDIKIYYKDKVGVLTYNIGNVSVIGNAFLLKNPEIDFFLDITSKKTMSFRANGNADVSIIAKELVGGGGHINASGGMFNLFKDGFIYENIKKQVENLLKSKENS